jgi:hypothetical protein
LFDLLKITGPSSIYPTLTHQIFLGKSETHPTWLAVNLAEKTPFSKLLTTA